MPAQRRGERFVSRVVVPVDIRHPVGRGEIAKIAEEANAPVGLSVGNHLRTMFDEVRKQRSLSKEQMDALVRSYLDAELDQVESRYLSIYGPKGLDHPETEGGNVFAHDRAERADELLSSADIAPITPRAKSLLDMAGLSLDESSLEFRQFCLRLLDAQRTAAVAEIRASSGDPSALLRTAASAVTQEKPKAVSQGSPQLSECITRFLAFKDAQKSWDSRTRSTNVACYAELVSLVGDKPAAEVTKADLSDFYQKVPQLPSRGGTKFKGKSAAELIELTKDMDIPRLAPKSVNKRFQLARSLWNWMEKQDIVAKNIAADVLPDVRTGKGREARDAFSDTEVLAILSTVEGTKHREQWHKWIAPVLAFSGMRLQEACGLRKQDIKKVDGIWCFNIEEHDQRGLKNETTARLVPIHTQLVKACLLKYIESVREGNLWGLREGVRDADSGRVSKWLNRVIDKAIGHDAKKVAHSWRHTIATKLKGHDVPEYVIAELVGHENDSITTGRYGKKVDVSRLRKALELITFKAFQVQ
ncbi:MAG TPA: site-specific integrase [Steroidobacteraceae bacterium]|nr:site-specific integrase [Steroidobacteraceae bacterium]